MKVYEIKHWQPLPVQQQQMPFFVGPAVGIVTTATTVGIGVAGGVSALAVAGAVGTIIAAVGVVVSVVGLITGDNDLVKIGGYMGLAGGVVSLASSALSSAMSIAAPSLAIPAAGSTAAQTAAQTAASTASSAVPAGANLPISTANTAVKGLTTAANPATTGLVNAASQASSPVLTAATTVPSTVSTAGKTFFDRLTTPKALELVIPAVGGVAKGWMDSSNARDALDIKTQILENDSKVKQDELDFKKMQDARAYRNANTQGKGGYIAFTPPTPEEIKAQQEQALVEARRGGAVLTGARR